LNKVLPQFRGEGSLEGWVKKVITSEILNQIRRGKNKSTIQTTNDFDFDRDDIEDGLTTLKYHKYGIESNGNIKIINVGI
jgi:DNA-directed RNA polymerase specialized sigma24 family protein